jgi:hypothetical protein
MDKSTPKGPNYRKWYVGESYLHQESHDRRNAKRFLDGKELRTLNQMWRLFGKAALNRGRPLNE